MVELRNQADGLVYSTDRTLREFAESVTDEEREPLEDALAKVRDLMECDEVAALRGAFEELSSLTYQLTENLYARLGAEEGEEGEGDPDD